MNKKQAIVLMGAGLLIILMTLLLTSCEASVTVTSKDGIDAELISEDSLSITVLEKKVIRGVSNSHSNSIVRISSQGHEYLITTQGGIIHMEHCLHRDIDFRIKNNE